MPLRYRPLRTDNTEIRLLEILPVKDKSRLSFRLHHTSLANAPRFWALSYTWGNPTDKLTIAVDNHDFGVTRNLYWILWNHVTVMEYGLTKPQEFRGTWVQIQYIWVDSICINQANFQERAEQIRLMGQIYATGVVGAYLDSKDKTLDRQAVMLLEGNGYQQRLARSETESDYQIKLSENEWVALYNFFTKTWFRRIWVVQEICLAKNPMFWMDTRPLPVEDMYLATREIFKMPPQGLTKFQAMAMLTGMRECLALLELRYSMELDQSPWQLASLLWLFRDRVSTDPRDKVYALLGLLTSSKTQGPEVSYISERQFILDNIIVDYNADLEDVYASVVKAVAEYTGCLDIICASQSVNTFRRSWVPNWAEPWERFSLLANNVLQCGFQDRGRRKYRASASLPASVTFSQNLGKLSAAGISCGEVTLLIDPPPCQHLRHQSVLSWLLSCLSQLPRNIQESVFSRCGKKLGRDHDIMNSLAIGEVGTEWVNAMHGGPVSEDQGRATDPFYFITNCDPDWCEMSRSFRRLDMDGLEKGFRDLRFHQLARRRRLFVDNAGSFGWVPDGADIGDVLCVVLGCNVPVVLRPTGIGNYTFIGEAYVHHLMGGQAIEALEKGDVQLTEFSLI